MMKKFIFILMICLMSSPCMAFENYMLMTDHTITDIKISNEDIITVEPMNTLKGEGCGFAMMIIPHNVGTTRLSFKKGKKRMNLCVRVTENRTCIKHVNGVKLVPVDLPPELK